MNFYKICLSIFLIILVGCTQKKNIVDTNNGTNDPQEIIFGSDIFEEYYCFEDSINNYSNNTKLFFGQYRNIQSISLIKITSLPDTISEISGNMTICFRIADELNKYNLELQIGSIMENWLENEATWFAASDTTDWENPGNFNENIIDNFNWNIHSDSLEIIIEDPFDLVNNWIEDESENFGFYILSDIDNCFLELSSSESEDPPYLTFDYKAASEDTLQTFSGDITSDTFIYSSDEDFQKFDDTLILSDIQPVKMFLKFSIADSLFIDSENSVVENSDDYDHMTINKAELILYSDEDHLPDNKIWHRSYLVTNDNPDIPFILDEDYEYIMSATSDSLEAGEFQLDVTDIIQSFTSGQNENMGILIKSTTENRDYNFITFFGLDAEETKRPKLKIIYTPPYLDE